MSRRGWVVGQIGWGRIPGPNLLTEQEATFETGGPLWSVSSNGTPTLSRVSPGSTGSFACKVLATTTDNLAAGLQGFVTRLIPVTLNVSYTVTGTFKALNSQNNFSVVMQGVDNSAAFKEGHSVPAAAGTISTTTFHTFTGTVTFTNAATTQARFRVVSGSGPIATNDFFIVDDLYFGLT